MKKTAISALLCMALTAGLLGGCGASGAAGSTESSTAKSEAGGKTVMEVEGENVTTLAVWTFIEMHQKFYTTMAEKWNEAHPDRKVKLELSNMQYDDMHNKLSLALESGQGAPDIADIELGKFPSFTAEKDIKLMDLSAVIAPYRDNVVSSRLDIYSKDGKYYGLPTHVGTEVAFYNTEALESAGIDYSTIKTWEDFRAAGVKYHEASGKEFACAETTAMWMVNLMLAQKGGDYLDASGKLAVNNEKVAEVLRYIKAMQEDGALSTVPGGQPDNEEAYPYYNDGSYAVQIMPFWQTSRFLNYLKDLDGKVAIAPVPRFGAEDATWTIGGGGTGTAVIAGSANAELAAEVMAYIKLSPEANEEIWRVLGFDPVNTSVWTDTALTEDPENQYVKFFKTKPFAPLLEMQEEIGSLKSLQDSKAPSINNIFCTQVLTNIFDSGADIRQELDSAQEQLENELG
ncbi:extracellular solute-binding protein [Oribacterium sp. oral taxon 102]|uniref:ABC transporter substrate-binding protein n=1 Tax=Oribacterium sp. oral taxon 102 TaxID=671214 RepID=UPI0015C1982F|nr:extracellular solute-binding protein [Oribacterium sp. oral taxon 102]NWO21559.1 extracellular solute-binding protein [Oribacterium sp. oral taxon 102]